MLAELALKDLLGLNEQHVTDDLSITYYNLGSALLKLGKPDKAGLFLKKAEEFALRLGNLERLAKATAKLADIKQLGTPSSLTFFNLPDGIILKVVCHLNISDIGRFASVSRRAQAITQTPYLWQKKLFTEFTEELIPLYASQRETKIR